MRKSLRTHRSRRQPYLPKDARPGTRKPLALDTDDDAPLRPLTPQQEKFVREYCLDLNGTRAARRAGYSRATAAVQAARLLGRPQIRQAVSDLLAKSIVKANLTVQEVIEGIKQHMHFDPRQLIDAETGEYIPIENLPEDVAMCVHRFEVILKNAQAGDGVIDKVLKVHGEAKLGWYALAAKYLGMLVEKVEIVNHEKNLAALEAGRQRVAAAKKARDAAAAVAAAKEAQSAK